MSTQEIVQQLATLAPWHMNIPLTETISTAAGNQENYGDRNKDEINVITTSEMENLLKQIYPDGLVGKRFLDIGCNAGGYCFIANQLGADYAYGFDVRDHWINQANFVKAHFQLQDDQIQFGVQHIDEVTKGGDTYDITLFKGVFYHLPFPVKSLVDLCKMTNEIIIVDTATRNDIPEDCMAMSMESDTRLMSGVDRLCWCPGGPKVVQNILKWADFPHTAIGYYRKSNIQQDARKTVYNKNRGRMRIIGARDSSLLEHYLKANPPQEIQQPLVPKNSYTLLEKVSNLFK